MCTLEALLGLTIPTSLFVSNFVVCCLLWYLFTAIKLKGVVIHKRFTLPQCISPRYVESCAYKRGAEYMPRDTGLYWFLLAWGAHSNDSLGLSYCGQTRRKRLRACLGSDWFNFTACVNELDDRVFRRR